MNDGPVRKTSAQVLCYIPNIVGYVRLVLLVLALWAGHAELLWLAFYLFVFNFTLDGLDGILARSLNQTSAFGAWLDVTTDNLTRGVLWAWSLPGPWAALPIGLEFLTFVATHKGAGGAAWKGAGMFSNAPLWVQAVMRNNFKSPAGSLAVAGLMGMPLWLWARKHLSGSCVASPAVGVVVILGRLVAFSVESWVLNKHIESLLLEG